MDKINKRLKVFFIKAFINAYSTLSPFKGSKTSESRKFLIVSTTGIGDTLWGTPAIKALRDTYPESYISVLTNLQGYEILTENPSINDIFIFRRRAAGLLFLPLLIKKLRQKKFDTVFIFHASDRIIWPICYLTGAGKIVGFEGQSKDLDFILTHKVIQNNSIHRADARFELVSLAGVPMSPKPLFLYLTDEEKKATEIFLKNRGISRDSLIIGVHPGAQKPFKCWPLKNFIAVGKYLAEKSGCRIIITGDVREKALADKAATEIKGAVSLAGALSLRETAAIIKRMHLFITNDTGPMHIAFALKTPTIALFSPTDPKLCGPYYTDMASVLQKPVTCTPCIKKKCYNPVCMEQITVHDVLEKADLFLKKDVYIPDTGE